MTAPGQKKRGRLINPETLDRVLPLFILIGLTLALTVGWDLFVSEDMARAGVFFKPENLGNVLRQNAHYGILAVGMTLVIVTAGIDLSVGALLAFSSVIMASMIDKQSGGGPGFALLTVAAGIGAGALLGLVNGFAITYFKAVPGWAYGAAKSKMRGERAPRLSMSQIQPFIVTLAMMSAARGLSFLWTGGRGIDIYGDQPPWFQALGKNIAIPFIDAPLPAPGLIFLLSALAAHVLLSRTRFGRFAYAIGSNEGAAVLSGVPVGRVKVLVYSLCGALCGLAGVIYTSVQNAGRPDDGVGFELDAIAAVVIGGASLAGGRGGIGGTVIGALIIGVLNNVLGLRNIDPNLQMVLKGLIIIAAVLSQRRRD